MTRSISITPSVEEVSIVCGYLQEDPRAVRGYLGFLQRHTNAENHNFANWVIRHVLIDPPAQLKARVAQTANPHLQAVASSQTQKAAEPKTFTLSLSEGARLKFVREMALFAAETADLEALDYALALPAYKETLSVSIYALASSSLCGCCKLSTLEHLVCFSRSSCYFSHSLLAVILRSLKDKDFVQACFALSEYYTDRSFTIAISAACSGISVTLPQHTSEVNTEVNAILAQQPNTSSWLRSVFSSNDSHYYMAHTKIAALRKLYNQNIEHVLALLANCGDARSVEILLNLEDVRKVDVDMEGLVADGHVEVLRVILNHPKYRRYIDPRTEFGEAYMFGAYSFEEYRKRCREQGNSAVDAEEKFAFLRKLIDFAAGRGNVEVLRLLIRTLDKYFHRNIYRYWETALERAIEAQNTENVEEVLQLLPPVIEGWYPNTMQALKKAVERDCVSIVFLARRFYHAENAQLDLLSLPTLKLEDLFIKDISLPMLKLLMESPQFAKISLKALKRILYENRLHTATILAAYSPFRTLTLEELNQFGLLTPEYVDALKALGRLEEILPQTVYDQMHLYVKEADDSGVSTVQAISQMPQFQKLEKGQLIELYRAAARRPFVDYMNILIHSPRFQDIDPETLGQELMRAAKLVTFNGSDLDLCRMYTGINLNFNAGMNPQGDREYVAALAPRVRPNSAKIMKAMMAAPRLCQISEKHLWEFIKLAMDIKDNALLREVRKFVKRALPQAEFTELAKTVRDEDLLRKIEKFFNYQLPVGRILTAQELARQGYVKLNQETQRLFTTDLTSPLEVFVSEHIEDGVERLHIVTNQDELKAGDKTVWSLALDLEFDPKGALHVKYPDVIKKWKWQEGKLIEVPLSADDHSIHRSCILTKFGEFEARS